MPRSQESPRVKQLRQDLTRAIRAQGEAINDATWINFQHQMQKISMELLALTEPVVMVLTDARGRE